MDFKPLLEKKEIRVSVPCRVDLGGTLDISTFYLPLNHVFPSTFNIALDMRTFITLLPYRSGHVKISSKGFESAEFEKGKARFDHPMGLMFACANYYNAHGVHIKIESTSPPRSALGGSSTAAVGIIAAFLKAMGKTIDPAHTALLAHYIESSVAGVPCGMQDQLAAAYGGVNQWVWRMGLRALEFEKKDIFDAGNDLQDFNSNILMVYCGIPHESKNINQRWVDSFIRGETRHIFEKVSILTGQFCEALREKNFQHCARIMNEETGLRMEMTPDVLDDTGKKLHEKAVQNDCGARFTGAGGGGCLWAVGTAENIKKLKPVWKETLKSVKDAKILDAKIDSKGII